SVRSAPMLSLLVVSCAGSVHPIVPAASRVPIEVWTGGGDALTIKFRDALEAAFKESPFFAGSSGKRPGTLIVTIPSALRWEDVGKRTRVSYRVTYSDVTD